MPLFDSSKKRWAIDKTAYEIVRGVSRSGRFLAVDNVSAGTETLSILDVWDTSLGKRLFSIEEPAGTVFRNACWSPSESRIASLASRFSEKRRSRIVNVSWWAASTGRKLRTIELDTDRPGCVSSVSWSPDETLLAVQHGLAGGIIILGARDGLVRKRIVRQMCLNSHIWSPDSSQIFAAGDHRINCISTANGRRQWEVRSNERILRALDISPDGTVIATGAGDRIRIAHAASGRSPFFLLADTYKPIDETMCRIAGTSFSPDMDFVAAYSSTRGFLWDLNSKDRIGTFDGLLPTFLATPPLLLTENKQEIAILEFSA